MRVLETVLCLDPESCTAAETLSRLTVSIHCQSLMHVSQVILDVTVDLTLTGLTDTYTCHQSGQWMSEDGTPLPTCLPGMYSSDKWF